VGDVPAGLPSVVLPDLGYLQENATVVLTAALSLLLIGFSQSAGDARAFASAHRYQVNINQESLAQGMANVGSGLVQGIPVSSSLSASSLNDQSGAKTPFASLTTGVLVVLTMLFLAPLFSGLPAPVLGALIIEAVVMGMMDVPAMRRLFHVKRTDFWIAIAALVGVLSAGVLAGVVIGVALSVGWLVYVSAVPEMPVLARQPGHQVFRPLAGHPGDQTYAGVIVLRYDAGLFFIDADALEDRIRQLAVDEGPSLKIVVVDFEGVNYVDSQGSEKVGSILDLAGHHDVELRLARVKPAVVDVLRRDGVIDRLGEEHLYGNVYQAVEDQIPTTEP
jgi:MFS superfamily sulfate permease-like transporter